MRLDYWLKFPLSDQNWLVKVIVGGVLNLIPIINFFSCGYIAEVIQSSLRGQPAMVEWDNWGAKFIKGLMVSIIGLIYMLIPIILLLATGVGSFAAFNREFNLAFMGIGAFIASILALVIGFIIPMAVLNYLATNRLGAAFALRQIFNKILSVLGEYILTYILAIVIFLFAGFISGIIPLIGWIFATFLAFYLTISVSGMFVDLYLKGK